jgi:hypothetical protein
MLYRPTFAFCVLNSAWLEQEGRLSRELTLQHSVAKRCCVMCIQSAQDAVDIIHTQLIKNNSARMLSPWWKNVYCEPSTFPPAIISRQLITETDCYTAAMILLAARTSQTLMKELGASLHSVMIQCYDILREYSPLSTAANTCLTALIWLRDRLGLRPILFSRKSRFQVDQLRPAVSTAPSSSTIPGVGVALSAGEDLEPPNTVETGDFPISDEIDLLDNGAGSAEETGHVQLGDIPSTTEFFDRESVQDLSWLDSIPFDFHFHHNEMGGPEVTFQLDGQGHGNGELSEDTSGQSGGGIDFL